VTYAEAQSELGDRDCVALNNPDTRLRRESPRCIALYYDGRPIVKWLDNGDFIVHNRGVQLTTAAQVRIVHYSPVRFSITGVYGNQFSVGGLPTGWGPTMDTRGGIRFNAVHKTKTRIA
jgi:hypothetical protein